jgi:hypothetical protein
VIELLVFIVSLPLTVYTISGCLALIDQQDPAGRFRALLRLSFRIALFVVLILSTPPGATIWVLIGVITTIVLTASGQIALRYLISSGRWPAERID